MSQKQDDSGMVGTAPIVYVSGAVMPPMSSLLIVPRPLRMSWLVGVSERFCAALSNTFADTHPETPIGDWSTPGANCSWMCTYSATPGLSVNVQGIVTPP